MAEDAPNRSHENSGGDPDHLEHALRYAGRGWPVFPVRVRGKAPLTRHGHRDATTTPGRIREWWNRWPEAGIGVPAGEETFIALDLDRHGQHDGVEAARELYGFRVEGPAVQTGGNGLHAYYRHPGGKVKSMTGEAALAPGVELKGDGGYTILPPSIHPSGRRYRWVEEPAAELPDPPEWLLRAIQKSTRRASQRAGKAPERIPRGRRNETLTSLAGTMRRRGLEAPEIAAALLVVNERRCKPPLAIREVQQIASSVERYETKGLFPDSE